MLSGLRRLVFVIGGPYGFSEAVYARANAKLSLSRMTYSHQLVRVVFVEQIYRAFTILNHEPYHHE
jgi:23S rRNA (pseudouridine1915-N3)-methyltransferase